MLISREGGGKKKHKKKKRKKEKSKEKARDKSSEPDEAQEDEPLTAPCEQEYEFKTPAYWLNFLNNGSC